MRVAPDVYLVASGLQGCGSTDDLDCNCWLFDGGGQTVLFDTGAGVDVPRLIRSMEADGLRPEALSHVVLTHGHADHSGGAAEIKERLGAKILCGAATAELMRGAPGSISLDVALKAGVYPPDYRYRAPVPDGILAPGAALEVGGLRIVPVATPGHSLDHMSYLVTGAGAPALVAGDALFHSGRIIYQASYDFDVRRSGESIRALAELEFDRLLPGHGMFVLAGARRHVGAALAELDAMRPPAPLALAKL